MSLIEDLLIFLSILGIYFLSIFILYRKNILEKFNISLYGPALLLRTKKGKKILKKLATKKRFWKAYGSSGIVLCFIVMILMVSMLIWQVWAIADFTPEQVEQLPGIEFILIIPGVNPIIPIEYIWFIIIALIVGIIVHEFSHGILTIASKLKVKSLGILYFIIPIGAFVEPDEEKLKKTKTGNRMRVYAAGPTSNFVVVLISLLLLSFIFLSAIQPMANGAVVYSVDKNSPASEVGIEPGTTIISLNDTEISNMLDYFILLNQTHSNQTVNITYIKYNHVHYNNIHLNDKYEEWEKRPEIYLTNNKSNIGKGYLGVSSVLRDDKRKEHLSYLKNPFLDLPGSFFFLFGLPIFGYFQGYNPLVEPFNQIYTINGPLSILPTEAFWSIVNTLYWIFWLNLILGMFNVLPMAPLDGGFLFNDIIDSLIKKTKKDISSEQRGKLVKQISLILSLTILFLVLFPLFIKYL